MLLAYGFTVQWIEDVHLKAMCNGTRTRDLDAVSIKLYHLLWKKRPAATLPYIFQSSDSMYVCLDVSSCVPAWKKKPFIPPRKILTALLAFFPNQSSCHFDLSEVYISPRASESEKLLGEIFMSRSEGYKLLPGGWTCGTVSHLNFISRSRRLARQRE